MAVEATHLRAELAAATAKSEAAAGELAEARAETAARLRDLRAAEDLVSEQVACVYNAQADARIAQQVSSGVIETGTALCCCCCVCGRVSQQRRYCYVLMRPEPCLMIMA